jgi:hypothetical protein
MLKQAAATGLVAWATLASAGALADGMPGASLKDTPSVVPIWSGIYVGAGVGWPFAAENNHSSRASPRLKARAAGGLGIPFWGTIARSGTAMCSASLANTSGRASS